MMRYLPVLLALAIVAPMTAAADPAISDRGSAAELLGKHALTLQWLGFGDLRTAGTATVVNQGGHWRLTGKQEAKEGFVTLDGEVTAIGKASFDFQGKVVTQAEGNNNNKPCAREGRYSFLRKPGKKYWRMQPIDNPCDPVADYIDIYLR
jgi:hypothetical protein